MWDLSSSGIEPTPSALEVQSLNSWTTREVPLLWLLLVHHGQHLLVSPTSLSELASSSNWLVLMVPGWLPVAFQGA